MNNMWLCWQGIGVEFKGFSDSVAKARLVLRNALLKGAP